MHTSSFLKSLSNIHILDTISWDYLVHIGDKLWQLPHSFAYSCSSYLRLMVTIESVLA